jgi:ech hydrogenase subunit E
MHSAILRSGGIIHSLPLYLMKEVILMITQNAVKLQEIHNLVTRNRIFITRLASVAIISKKISEVYGLSGVLIRATDFKKDLRVTGYEYYGNLEFNVVNSSKGDSLDR